MDIKSYDVYSQMCVLADEIQAIKSSVGWFDQYDYILNRQTGIKLIGLQLIQNKYDENTAWIPTQSQVQLLIRQLQNNLSLIIEDFEDWYMAEKDFFESIPNLQLDSLYLMYYMERYKRKFWCWGCGFWKDISEKQYEIIERKAIMNSSRIIAEDNASE